MQPGRLDPGPLLEEIGAYTSRRGMQPGELVGTNRLNVLRRQGRQDIGVTLDVAEDLCDLMGLHPRMLYSEAWDTAVDAGRLPAELAS